MNAIKQSRISNGGQQRWWAISSNQFIDKRARL